MIIKAGDGGAQGPTPIPLRCPGCGRDGVFQPFDNVNDVSVGSAKVILAQRRCPNPHCRTHAFVVADQQHKALTSYPAQRIDFDKSNVPQNVLRSFEEALTCHANACYIGGAMLVRRTLEELCADQGATGKTLADRLRALRNKVVLPEPLFKALDEIRLLGNDAAHVEAKDYDNVGEVEVRVGIALTKEILKSVYQLDALVGQLTALKKP